jgi:hypothetical protein
MNIQISYRPLCSVKILHGYYLHPNILSANILNPDQQRDISDNLARSSSYTILKDLTITPAVATQQLMAGYRIVFRSDGLGFSLWLQVEKHGEIFSPFIPFTEPLCLTFQLQVKQTSFWNFTNLPLNDSSSSLYYFSNQANNSSGGTNYLNRDGAYASDHDRITVRPNEFSLDVAALNLTRINFVLANDFHRSEISLENPEIPLDICHLDWRHMPSGLYRLTAFDTSGADIPPLSQQFYLNSGDMPVNTLAVVEIFYLPGSDFGSYALLDPADNRTLLRPEYTLWWQNRLTHWRYIFDRPQSISPDPDSDVTFTGPEQTQLVTRLPQPLVSGYRPIRFRQDIAGTEINGEILLPNPGVEMIYPESSGIYSEVYLGNFDMSRV